MLYKSIRLGCELYHNPPAEENNPRAKRYNKAYSDFLRYRHEASSKWDRPELLGLEDASSLRRFLDEFLASSWHNIGETHSEDLLEAMQDVIPNLRSLQNMTLLDVDFSDVDIANAIKASFLTLERCGPDHKSYPVAASKILHAINPEVFVMWDGPIIEDHVMPHAGAYPYTHCFLPRMKRLANSAITELEESRGLSCVDAIRCLTPCSNSLARALDEYNYVRAHMEPTFNLRLHGQDAPTPCRR